MKNKPHLIKIPVYFSQDSIDKINSFCFKINSFSSKINSFINDEINTNEVAK